MNRTIQTVLAVVFILIIAVCAALSASAVLGRSRIDLTEDNLYTLSQGTRNIVGRLNRPITAKLYYSRSAAMRGPEQIRHLNKNFLYVRDLLEVYRAVSNGIIELEVIDPGTYTEEEEDAIEYGLRQEWIAEDESFFFGLVLKTETGRQQVIEFFDPNRVDLVEYDISRLISELIRRRENRVGILSSLPVAGEDLSPYMRRMMEMQGQRPPPWWHIGRHLQNRFEVERVSADTDRISRDLDLLLVVHPKELPEQTLFAIDQYVMRGGKLVVFVDPWCLDDHPPQQQHQFAPPPAHDRSSNLNGLLERWGARMVPDRLTTDPALLDRTEVGEQVQTPRGPEMRYRQITFLVLRDRSRNRDEVITSRLGDIRMLYPGALEPVPADGVEFIPLLTTTETGTTWDFRDRAEPTGFGPEPEVTLEDLARGSLKHATGEEGKPVVLACRLSGTFRTNFPDGLIIYPDEDEWDADDDEPAPQPEHLEAIQESEEGAQVVVFADVDFISDWLAYRRTFLGPAPVGGNAALVLNTVEFLGGDTDLIEVRSRRQVNRPFLVVEEMEKEIERATAERESQLEEKKRQAQERLEELQRGVTEETRELVDRAQMEEIQRWRRELDRATIDLRRLRAENRERIDALKARLQFHNLVWAPITVLLIGIGLAIARRIKARVYTARRAAVSGPTAKWAHGSPVGTEQLVLGGVAIVMVVITATLLTTARYRPRERFVRGTPLVQAIDTEDIHTIRIVDRDDTVTLARADDREFVVAELHNYPADRTAINRLIVRDVLDITCDAVVTRDPDLHDQFGVTEGHPDAIQISFLDRDGEPLVELIRGKSSERGGVYVRLLGENRVYRTRASFWPDTRPLDYVDNTIAEAERRHLKRVEVQIGEKEPYVIERDDENNPRLQGIPDGMRAKEHAPRDVFEALTRLDFTGVLTAEDFDEMDLEWDAAYTADLFTGLRYRLELASRDDDHYIRVRADWLEGKRAEIQAWITEPDSGDAQTRRADAVVLHQDLSREFNAQHGGWVYRIARHKARHLRRPFDELIEEDLPEEVRARHILIAYQDAEDAPDDVDRGKEQAEELAQRLLGQAREDGADFAALAREHSDDHETREDGGDLGEIETDPADWPDDFWKPLFRLKPGQVADLIETDRGYHIIQRTDGLEPEPVPEDGHAPDEAPGTND